VVVADGGVDGLVLAIAMRGITIRDSKEHAVVSACAGEPWDELVSRSVELGLRGLECLSGIPGLVGATPIQNVGAYGQEIADTVVEVRAFDRVEKCFVTLTKRDCLFAYRDSRFKSHQKGRFVISAVDFRLDRGVPQGIRYPELRQALDRLGREPTLADVRETVIALRRSKSMVVDRVDENSRSCGSFFVNPTVTEALAEQIERRFAPLPMPRYPQEPGWVKLSAAWLIERAGLAKGTRAGNVGISTRHALALVCHEGATATELLAFECFVRERVRERTGVVLTPEPIFWGSTAAS